MTSRRPYWCPKTMKRRPCWCPKRVQWGLNSFLMQTLSFVPINLHRCWPREWKHSIWGACVMQYYFSVVFCIFKYPPHQLIIGSLRNDDGDVNENGNKYVIGLAWQNNNSTSASRFLHISLNLCRRCTTTTCRKCLILSVRPKQKTATFLFFSWTSL